ncbi:XRE family transcriptional regulator [Sinorhizobium alkalisoli]|uniref:XRE family transcriptional regulator n=1 Tax=Sinorhizobium alkalisoli TaxID=1752398 RepID=UPI001FE38BC7|nr:helix-turn-helix transcriptional regulator [Sinorhizobium alkalisoli]
MHIREMTPVRKIDEERGARIKQVRTDMLKLRSQEQLAELLSKEGKPVTRGAVGNWELGKEVGLDSLTTICRVSGVSLEWLAYGRGEPFAPEPVAPEPANAKITGEMIQKGPKIPLYGAAVGGDYGEFELNGHRLDDIFAPPSLSGIPEAYGVQVSGDSMYPRYEDGETVYVNPRRRPVKGDYVVAEIQTEEHGPKLAYIKKLIRHTQSELILEQFNPAKQIRFDGRQVHTVHYVLKSGE